MLTNPFNTTVVFLFTYFTRSRSLYVVVRPSVYLNQSINQFICPEINTHWTGHQGRTQPPLTVARKNKVSKNNK